MFIHSAYDANAMLSALPTGPTEAVRETRGRLVQGFFRETVLLSYQSQCAVREISERGLLIASHIIPWQADEKRRAELGRLSVVGCRLSVDAALAWYRTPFPLTTRFAPHPQPLSPAYRGEGGQRDLGAVGAIDNG